MSPSPWPPFLLSSCSYLLVQWNPLYHYFGVGDAKVINYILKAMIHMHIFSLSMWYMRHHLCILLRIYPQSRHRGIHSRQILKDVHKDSCTNHPSAMLPFGCSLCLTKSFNVFMNLLRKNIHLAFTTPHIASSSTICRTNWTWLVRMVRGRLFSSAHTSSTDKVQIAGRFSGSMSFELMYLHRRRKSMNFLSHATTFELALSFLTLTLQVCSICILPLARMDHHNH